MQRRPLLCRLRNIIWQLHCRRGEAMHSSTGLRYFVFLKLRGSAVGVLHGNGLVHTGGAGLLNILWQQYASARLLTCLRRPLLVDTGACAADWTLPRC